jgi:peroxiredoxin
MIRALSTGLFLLFAFSPETALARSTNERPLPAFAGLSLDGEKISISDYIGKRLLLVFFNPEVAEAAPVVEAVRAVHALQTSHNFEVVGVSVGSTRSKSQAFRHEHHLDFPILDDSPGNITRRLGLQAAVTIVAADAEGYMIWGASYFDAKKSGEALRVEDAIREALRLPERSQEAMAFGERQRAPLFEAIRLDGGDPFRLQDYEGRPIVLIFFSHTCPHCHHALQFLEPVIEKIPAEKRPALVAISIQDRPGAVREVMKELGIETQDVLLDPERKLQNLYQVQGGVPDIFFIDPQRRVVHRVQGWREKRDPALSRMTISKIAGERIPFLLNPKGYTGSDVCGVCHELELESWHYTKHANAYDTLVTHAAERNPECIGCHVVGYEKPGGYTIEGAPAHLEDVSCESCHGRGGPHLSKGFVQAGDYEAVCVACHNPTHSLGFEYESFRKNISHIQIAAMTPAEREGLGGTRPGNLMPTGVDYVGSEACRSCHASEFATWQTSPHARSLASLEKQSKSGDAACQKCHTTAFDLPGGFPKGAVPDTHPDLARVGCESCHGPGEAHIGEQDKKIGSILSLGDKCDSCVILQICGGCHDDANDPGFAFEVVEKIEIQRHGTLEPGTGRPLEGAADAEGASPEQPAEHPRTSLNE